MYYFIPAWYGQGVEFWQPDMTPWYNRRKKLILMIHSIK
ncbi:accessory Sec system protein Asp1 [Streptococcus australis]|nr:accessory Sec system glycosyltransferase Asp1 [Streptococcus australis]SQH67215.1 accessory Sec system protein Asp1 [Streptococcus australis]